MVDFPPLKVSGPYRTLPLDDFLTELIEIAKLKPDRAERILYSALQRGALTAYLYTSESDTFHKVISKYWNPKVGNFPTLSLHAGKLLDIEPNQSFPSKLEGRQLLLFREATDSWLKRQKLPGVTMQPLLPSRSTKPAHRRSGGLKPRYGPQLRDQALERLRDEGGFTEAFTKAALERELAEWALNHLEAQPAPSTVREHINRAYAVFRTEKGKSA